MKKYGKIIVVLAVAILIIVLVVVLKNKSLNKIDLQNDFGSIEYSNDSPWGGSTKVKLSSNHELEYTLDNSSEDVTIKTLTDTEYNSFMEKLTNSGIEKLPEKIGVEGNESSLGFSHQTITINLLNGKKFERSGYAIEEQEFKTVVQALLDLTK